MLMRTQRILNSARDLIGVVEQMDANLDAAYMLFLEILASKHLPDDFNMRIKSLMDEMETL